MPISNYPNGFAQGVAIRGIPLLNLHGGNVFWVDSVNGADTGKGTHNQPFATLDYAIGRCAAAHGDKIIIKANHAETIATASAITADIAGIEVVCLGEGAARPTFTFSAVDATMVISAASFTMKNFIVKPSIDSVVSPIVVSGADCTLDYECQDASAMVECVNSLLTTAGADRLTVNCKYRGFLAGNACVNAIRLVGVDSARIYVDFYGVASTSIVEFHTTACHDIDVRGLFYNDGTSLTKNVVDTATGSTWSCQGWDGNSNAIFSGGDNSALSVDVALGNDGITAAKIADNAFSEEHFDGDAVQAVTMGKKVSKATAILAGTSTVDLFTVATGRVVVHAIVGEVTTLVQTQATVCKLISTPTTGTAADLCATLDLTADEAGCLYGITGLTGDALIGTNAGATICPKHGVVVPIGVIGFNNASAANTGSVKWDIYYTPLDTGATIVSA